MKKIIHIKGTHCKSCKMLLEREIGKINNVKSIKVDFETGKSIVWYKNKWPGMKIKEVVTKYNYGLGTNKQKSPIETLMETTIVTMIVINGWFLLKFLGLEKYLPNSQSENVLLSALLMGVAASLSTCLALVGSIILSMGTSEDRNENWRKNGFFHLGRLVSFGVLGGILGLVGGKLSYSTNVIAVISLAVGMYTGYKGLETVGIIKGKGLISFGTGGKVGQLVDKNQSWPIILGGLTFFIPCGFTQTAQIMAVSSNGFGQGALIMLVFGLGTLPVLLIIGISTGVLKTEKYSLVKKVIGFVIVGLAISTILSSARLINFGTKGVDQTANINNINSGDVQIIKMDVSSTFVPSEFVIKKGVPVRWEINGDRATGCTNEVIIPKLKISSGKLKRGVNIVEFTPTETGVLPFSCWMGMVRGKFIVE